MKNIQYLVFLSLFSTSCLNDSEPPIIVGIISGTVYNSQTMEVVQGVTITTDPATSSVITGANGSYEILDVPEGTYILTASHPSYETKTTTVQVISDRSVTVDLQLTPLGPELSVSEDALNFGTETDNLTFHIQNTGIGTMNWSLSKNQNWLTVSPTSGTTTTETDIVNVSVNRSGYSPGNYTDVISLSSDANAKSISVIMTVADTTGPQLSVSPASFDFGSSQTEKTFEINNTGVNSLSWNASSSNNWVSIETTSGTITTETGYTVIFVNRADLSAGTYSGAVSFTSNGGNQTVSITVSVEEANLSITPTSLEFGSSDSELELYITNNGSSTVQWQLTPTTNWISANPDNGSVAVTPVSSIVTVDRSQLSLGDHDGNVILSYSGNSTTIPVTVSVTSAILESPELQITSSTGTSVTLSWTRPTDNTSFNRYDIRRSTEPDISETVEILTSITSYSTNTYTDANLPLSTIYYYKVYAVNNDGVGSGSNEVDYTTDMGVPGTWVVQADLDDGYASQDISMLSNSLGYILKREDGVYELAGTDWSNIGGWGPSGNYYYYYSIVAISQNEVWACGNDYRIRRYNGVSWELLYEINCGTNSWSCVTVHSFTSLLYLSESSVWVGGGYYESYGDPNEDDNDPFIVHYNGTDFTEYSLNDNVGEITSLSFVEEDEGYALTSFGQVYHWNGIGWSIHTTMEDMPGTGAYYKDIVVWEDGTMFVTRDYQWYDSDTQEYNSAIYKYNGTTWEFIETPGYGHNHFVMFESGIGWSVGDIGQILFTGNGGENWQTVTSPTDVNIYKMDWIDESYGWAVGAGGVVLRYLE